MDRGTWRATIHRSESDMMELLNHHRIKPFIQECGISIYLGFLSLKMVCFSCSGLTHTLQNLSHGL